MTMQLHGELCHRPSGHHGLFSGFGLCGPSTAGVFARSGKWFGRGPCPSRLRGGSSAASGGRGIGQVVRQLVRGTLHGCHGMDPVGYWRAIADARWPCVALSSLEPHPGGWFAAAGSRGSGDHRRRSARGSAGLPQPGLPSTGSAQHPARIASIRSTIEVAGSRQFPSCCSSAAQLISRVCGAS